ncbi:MAG: large conductance mechanosensitive channel protein MscL [Bacteroidetes bacterium]|nr:large conductance mechanosensitive channel protein MscL [Bacteroidota bacterium]
MGFVKEFKDFAMKGNLVDISVAFVMGAAFGKVVTALTEGIVAPLIGLIGGDDLSKYGWTIKEGTKDAAGKVTGEVVVKYGTFLTAAIDFILVALVMFLIIKGINSMKKKEADAAPAGPSSTDALLMEIRDALKK